MRWEEYSIYKRIRLLMLYKVTECRVRRGLRHVEMSEDVEGSFFLYALYKSHLIRCIRHATSERISKELIFLKKNLSFYGVIDTTDKIIMANDLLGISIKRMK